MASDEETRQTHQWEELRLGLIMNGGVSLAVWMGGVSNEIFRLVTHQHPVYRGLMDLTRTSARVDVISGTSAGGVNGAALAIALLYGGDFEQLREVWMRTGAFTDLLRSPIGANPGSLLQGEEYYLPALIAAFSDLSGASRKPCFDASVMPIDLRLTATLLSGHQGRNVDDMGAPVHDVDYRAQFRFERKNSIPRLDTPPDVFAERETMIRALARAARSSSSFPFAFEPSLVSPEDAGAWLLNTQQVALKTPRYAIDGGVMDNRPFRSAREGIFEMPRHSGVRRVLAYINPDPGDGKPFDLPAKSLMPGLSQVLSASIIGIPQSQSISDELQEIEAHNLSVRMRRDSVLSLAAAFRSKHGRLSALACDLFSIYRTRRLATTFEVFVFQPLSNAASRKPGLVDALTLIGKNGKETLKGAFIREGGNGWLPQQWPTTADSPCNRPGEEWSWGLFPVEFASKLMMNMLRMMQSLAEYQPTAAGRKGSTAAYVEVPIAASIAGADWSDSGDRHWSPDGLRAHLEQVLKPSLDTAKYLASWWGEAYEIVEMILTMRDNERTHWRLAMDNALLDLSRFRSRISPAELAGWQTRTVDALFAQIRGTTRRAHCAHLAQRIATVVRKAAKEVPKLIAGLPSPAHPNAAPLLMADRQTVDALASLASMFDQPSVEDTLYRLLQMEVVEFAFSDHESLTSDSTIELVQISGNGRSALVGNGDTHASDKLLGLQLAHFGAFYKQSWRANDWTYGRLDGASRLLAVLLNARRLHQIYARRREDAVVEITAIALGTVASGPLRTYLEEQWCARKLEQAIREELSFLDVPEESVPDSLPTCAAAIELRLHLGILRDELPYIANAVIRDGKDGADPMWSGHALVDSLREAPMRSDAPFSPQQAVAQLKAGLLAGSARRGENFAKEAGSDLFTRTLAHTIAALQNTLSSKAAKLGPISVLFAGLWLPTLGFHFVAQGLTRQSRTAAALHGAMLTTGLALVLLGLMTKGGLDGPLVQFGWLLLGFSLAISIIRAPRLFTGLTIAATLLLMGGVIYGGVEREYLVFCAMLALLTISVRWPALQVLVALAAIALAAFYSARIVEQPEPFAIGIWAAASLVALSIGIAALQACGALAAMEKVLRRWLIDRSEQ